MRTPSGEEAHDPIAMIDETFYLGPETLMDAIFLSANEWFQFNDDDFIINVAEGRMTDQSSNFCDNPENDCDYGYADGKRRSYQFDCDF